MKEKVKESYLKMLKAKLEEEIKSYEIAKKDTIEAEGRMVTRYDSTKTETGWLAAGYLELVNMLKKSIENFEQERRYINIGDLVTIDLFQNNRCEAQEKIVISKKEKEWDELAYDLLGKNSDNILQIRRENRNYGVQIREFRPVYPEENIVKIAIVGKYIKLEDSYLSVVESIKHAGYANEVDVEIGFVDSETINAENAKEKLEKFDGIIVPGGFGNRGIEGKIQTVKYARENNVPFLGICLGMQMAVIEFARDVLDLKDADSVEFNPDTKNPVIHIMEDQKNITKKGGTMRLGAYPCVLEKGTLASNLYGSEEISERHRHRYEFNNDYKKKMEEKKMVFWNICF